MTLECPKCKSPVAREGQRFCYRCGNELNAYYDSLSIKINASSPDDPLRAPETVPDTPPEPPPQPKLPVSTVILEPGAFGGQADDPPNQSPTASLKILLPTGDVFDRDITNAETQIGKGPRNDLVIADPAVSTAHAIIKRDGGTYTISDIGSRNGTYVNGDRVAESQKLNHGDVIGIGLSKLTFRIGNYSETGAIDTEVVETAAKPNAPPPLTEDSLAAAVIAAKLVSQSDVDRVRSQSRGRTFYQSLIEEQLATEDGLRDLMSRTFEIPLVDLKAQAVQEGIASEFPGKLARELNVFPISKDSNGFVIAIADPTDSGTIDRVKREIGSDISFRLATPTQLREQVSALYGPRLIGVLPSGDKLQYVIDKHDVEIGKATHNHIVLTDPTVSNTHAIVIAREGGYNIVDLGSRNGTFVNGERLGAQALTLKHGDKIQLGQTVLTFRNPGETNANVTAVLSGEALEEVRRRAGISGPPPQESQPQPQTPPAGPVENVPEGSAPAAADVAIAAGTNGNGDAEAREEKKKKKKKKKKDQDARLRAAYVSAWGRIFAAVLSVALTVALTLYLTRSSSPGKDELKISKKGHAKLKLPKSGAGTPIQGGTFEASGVVQVLGTNGVLFVDDAKLDEILWMQLDENGKQQGSVKSVSLGGSVSDLEGITYGDGYFYVTGSQSAPKDGDQNAIARFKFDASSQTIRDTEVIPNFRDFLLNNVSELKGDADKSGKDGGLNIEGLGWDPKRNRLLLGLRSPQLGDNALIVPVALINPGGAFTKDNLRVVDGKAIQLPLEGLGIRDIQYDSRLDAFLIISGAPEHHDKKLGFKLWQWSGDAGATDSEGLRVLTDLDASMKPEGITHFELNGRQYILIVGDAGVYTKIDYSESE